MSGTVDQSTIRSDVWQDGVDRIETGLGIALEEQSDSLRRENIEIPVERARTNKVLTLEEFYELFGKILDFAAEYEDKAYSIRFSRESPPEDIELPCFTVHLISRSPFSNDGRHKEYLNRFMEAEKDLDNPGDVIERYLRRQTNIIELKVWAKTGSEASSLAEWVEEKFYEYLWAFQWSGLGAPARWKSRGEDTEVNIREQRVFYCPMIFEIQTGKIVEKRVTAIRQLQIRLGIMSDDN